LEKNLNENWTQPIATVTWFKTPAAPRCLRIEHTSIATVLHTNARLPLDHRPGTAPRVSPPYPPRVGIVRSPPFSLPLMHARTRSASSHAMPCSSPSPAIATTARCRPSRRPTPLRRPPPPALGFGPSHRSTTPRNIIHCTDVLLPPLRPRRLYYIILQPSQQNHEHCMATLSLSDPISTAGDQPSEPLPSSTSPLTPSPSLGHHGEPLAALQP
jgi:hypothetical protein